MEEKKTSARKETAKPGINRTESKSDTDKDIMSDSHTGRKPKRNVRKLISALLVVSGLLFILVPLVMTQINARRNDDIIDQFLKEAQRAMSDAQAVSAEDILLPVSGGALESYDPSASDPNTDVESSEAFGDENKFRHRGAHLRSRKHPSFGAFKKAPHVGRGNQKKDDWCADHR